MKREMEETRQRQAEEERQYKKQEIEKQEQKLMAEREVLVTCSAGAWFMYLVNEVHCGFLL